MTPTLFIYPWLSTGPEALWDLRYSLRSISHNFCGNYQVLVVGDRPSGFGMGLWHTAWVKEASNFFPRCLDVNRKMEWVLQCPWVGEEFVHIHDDQLLLQPMDAGDLRRRIARNECGSGREGYGGSHRHTQLVERTVQALREAGITRVWNYETHLPRVFNTQKMREVFERFRPTENRLLYSTLYYNWVYPNQPPQETLSVLDNVKAAFYGNAHADGYSVPRFDRHLQGELCRAEYLRHLLGKRFLNYSNKGRTPELLNTIKALFPEPGPYELAPTPTTLTLA